MLRIASLLLCGALLASAAPVDQSGKSVTAQERAAFRAEQAAQRSNRKAQHRFEKAQKHAIRNAGKNQRKAMRKLRTH